MSAPKYLTKKPDSVMSIVIKAESLASYIFRITSNEKQFPKAYRYTLSSQLRNAALDLMKYVYKGCARKAITPKDYEKVRKYQDAAYDILIDIKSLLVISHNIASLNNPGYVAELYEDTVEAFNHWVKNTKRSERKAVWKEHLSDDDKYNLKMAYLGKKAKKMKHDSDGFITLIKRKSA